MFKRLLIGRSLSRRLLIVSVLLAAMLLVAGGTLVGRGKKTVGSTSCPAAPASPTRACTAGEVPGTANCSCAAPNYTSQCKCVICTNPTGCPH